MATQPLWLREEEVPALPSGWVALRTVDACIQLDTGKLYDTKSAKASGTVPILNQSPDGFLGIHDSDSGVLAPPESPVVTFANHTCAMRLMKHPFSCIQNIFPKTGRPGVCDTVYFYYAAQGRTNTAGYKGHHPLFRDAFIPVPPIAVQRKIASTLSAYDDLIENNLRRIQVLEEMAQALYREWFIEFRFPGHEGVILVESPMGAIPEGWNVRAIEEVASVNEVSLKPKSAPDEIAYVAISSVSAGRIESHERMPFSEAPGRARRVVRHGDTIWSNVRPNRRAYALILEPVEDLVVSTGFSVVTPKTVPHSFLYHALTTDCFVSYLVSHARGAAYPAVGRDDFDKARLIVPPTEVLDRFHGVAEPMLALAECLRRHNGVLAEARDLLLPRLVSGELDVSELDIELGGVA